MYTGNKTSFEGSAFFDGIFDGINKGDLSNFESIKTQVDTQTFIKLTNHYTAYFGSSILTHCIQYKRLDVLQWFHKNLPKAVFKDLVHSKPEELDYLPILKWLDTIMPSELNTIIKENLYKILAYAIQKDTLDVIEWIMKQDTFKQYDLVGISTFDNASLNLIQWIESNNFRLFNQLINQKDRIKLQRIFAHACKIGDIPLLEWFRMKIPDSVSHWIQFMGYPSPVAEFKKPSKIIDWLQTHYFDEFNIMLLNHSTSFFFTSLRYHDVSALKYLKKRLPDAFDLWLKSEFKKEPDVFNAQKRKKGFLKVLNWAKEAYPLAELKELMLKKNFLTILITSCSKALPWVKELDPEQFNAIILEDKYAVLFRAANFGRIETLKWLLKDLLPDTLDNMVQANHYSGVILAESNDINALLWFKQNLSDKTFKIMLSENHHEIFATAARQGNLDFLKCLKEQSPDTFEALCLPNNIGFWNLVLGASLGPRRGGVGSMDIITWIEEQNHLAFQQMMNLQGIAVFSSVERLYCSMRGKSSSYSISFQAIQKIIYWSLSYPTVLSDAESHVREYSYVVNPFIDKLIETIQNERTTIVQQNPNAVFDIQDVERAKLYFYVVRNIIRRNDPELNEHLLFLLSIPSVKVLAHQIIGVEGQPNQLLRLAMSLRNERALQILLNIRAVRQLAEADDYYIHERIHGVDLRQLARSRESSMTALTKGEATRFKKIVDCYTPDIQNFTTSNIITHLREDLLAHYKDNPAQIMVNKLCINLPADYDDFMKLSLSPENRKKAYQAYYTSTIHTALRYISNPNYWMHDEASFVYISEDRARKWSTFEEYQDIISLFYLAANDASRPPLDKEITIEHRVQLFFRELALIGRAHNWDKVRVRDGKNEEYDDLEGDRPSCFSGVKRRLFQSVHDHPLLVILSEEHIQNEIRQFAVTHYRQILPKVDPETVKTVLGDLYAAYDEKEKSEVPSLKLLALFNIPLKEQNAFIDSLSKKYGSDFDPFREYVQSKLKLDTSSIDTSYHLVTLSHLIEFYEYLEHLTSETPRLAHGIHRTKLDHQKIVLIQKALGQLQLKITDLGSRNYIEAQNQAQTIHIQLAKLVAEYEAGTIDDAELKRQAKPILDNRAELEVFRGWKLKKIGEILANLAILIFSLGISYAVTQQFTLFRVKSDSHESIEALSEAIELEVKF